MIGLNVLLELNTNTVMSHRSQIIGFLLSASLATQGIHEAHSYM